jgi:hypothetical protein
MHRSIRIITSLAVAAVVAVSAGCATGKQWAVTDSDRDEGLVRVSYEFPEHQEPELSDEQAIKLAESRCNGWGYDDAEPIAGQLRQCSSMNSGDCELWKVTREFQCTREVAFADRLAK